MLSEFLDRLPTDDAVCSILGDFNVDLLSDTPDARNLTSPLNNYGLTQVITEATRVTQNSSTLIDHIYVSDETLLSQPAVLSTNLSDHFSTKITFNGKIKSKTHRSIKYRPCASFDKNDFLTDLAYVPWHITEVFEDPGDALGAWLNLFLDVLDNHAPLREKRVKFAKFPGWWTPEITEAIRLRDATNKADELDLYRTRRNNVTSLIRKAKSDFYCSLLDKGKTAVSAFWKHFREVLPAKLQPAPFELRHMNSICNTPGDIANAFNDHFSSVAEMLIDHSHSLDPDFTALSDYVNAKITHGPLFDIPDFTVEAVCKSLKHLDIKKGAGLDGLQPKFLVMAADIIAPSLTNIFNLSLSTGIVPSIWKAAKVIPLHKKGALHDPSNYRPISILPQLSKIFERHIHTHLMAYLDQNDLLYKHQSGFRSFHSCQTALTALVDSWACDIDQNKLVGVLMIDLKKAFDLVNHNILLKKLSLYKCSNHCVSLLTSYLSCRTQQTLFQGHLSTSANISVGVPQGSILGPLLFLLYINDLHLIIQNSVCHMFADDSTFCSSSTDINEIERNLESDLSNISNWCSSNQMSLHLGKTKSMLVTTHQKRSKMVRKSLSINHSGNNIDCVPSHKLLGVTVQHNLSWKDHCDEICAKVRKSLYLLRKLKHILPYSAKLQFYNSFILPHFDYCSTVWFTGKYNAIKPLNILLKRAMRLILDVPFDTPSSDLFKALNWMSIEKRCLYNASILVFKSTHSLTPSYLNIFTYNTNRTRASSRNELTIPFATKDILKNSFRVIGAKTFNSLPQSIRESPSLESFKRACFKHFIHQFHNSL